jgi:hypothetical protein
MTTQYLMRHTSCVTELTKSLVSHCAHTCARASRVCVQTCNIFGGKDSCKPLPEDSEFGQTCKGDRQNLKTDCIYYKDAEAKMTINPTDSMSAALGGDFGRMKQHCPQCLRNMQAMVLPCSPRFTMVTSCFMAVPAFDMSECL